MLEDLRNYVQMASGLTEATTAKAKEVIADLLATGMSLSSKAIPNPEVMGQVQELADDLVATSRNNREILVAMIRTEVDKAVARMGFVREDELAALRRHVQRLEKQLADLQADPTPPAADARPDAVSTDAAPESTAPAGASEGPAEATPTPKKKKKKVIVHE